MPESKARDVPSIARRPRKGINLKQRATTVLKTLYIEKVLNQNALYFVHP